MLNSVDYQTKPKSVITSTSHLPKQPSKKKFNVEKATCMFIPIQKCQEICKVYFSLCK